MKPLIFIVLLSLGCYAAATEPKDMIEVIINGYLDKIFENLPAFMLKEGLEPLPVEEIRKSFETKPLFITYYGNLTLSNILVHDLTTIKRYGDATLRYEAGILVVRMALKVPTIHFNSDYFVSVMDLLDNDGGVEGTIEDFEILMDIAVDLQRFQLHLQEFSIPNAGKVDLKLTGNPLTDWLLNFISDLATFLLHDSVVNTIKESMEEIVNKVIDMINEGMLRELRDYVQIH